MKIHLAMIAISISMLNVTAQADSVRDPVKSLYTTVSLYYGVAPTCNRTGKAVTCSYNGQTPYRANVYAFECYNSGAGACPILCNQMTREINGTISWIGADPHAYLSFRGIRCKPFSDTYNGTGE